MSDVLQTKINAEYHRDHSLSLIPQEGQSQFGLAVHFKNAQGEDQVVAQMEKPIAVMQIGRVQLVDLVFTKMRWAEGHPVKDELTPYILQVNDLRGDKIVGTIELPLVVFNKDGAPKKLAPKPAPEPGPTPQPTPNGDKPGDKPATPPADEIKEITDRLDRINRDCVTFESELEKQNRRPPGGPLHDMAFALKEIRTHLAMLRDAFPNDTAINKLSERFNKTSVRTEQLAKARKEMAPPNRIAELTQRITEFENLMKNLKPEDLPKLREDVNKLQSEMAGMAKTADVKNLEKRIDEFDKTLGDFRKYSQKFSEKIDGRFDALSAQIASLGNAGSDDKGGKGKETGKGEDNGKDEHDRKAREEREEREREERHRDDRRHEERPAREKNDQGYWHWIFGILVLVAFVIIIFGFWFIVHCHPAAPPFPAHAPASPTVIQMPPMPNAGVIYPMTPPPAPAPQPTPAPTNRPASVTTGNVEMVPLETPPTGATPVAYSGTTLIIREKVPVPVIEERQPEVVIEKPQPMLVSYTEPAPVQPAPAPYVYDQNLYLPSVYHYGPSWDSGLVYNNGFSWGPVTGGVAIDGGWTYGSWSPGFWPYRSREDRFLYKHNVRNLGNAHYAQAQHYQAGFDNRGHWGGGNRGGGRSGGYHR